MSMDVDCAPNHALQPLLFGHYVLVGKLGEGAAGEVWRARDLRLGTVVALKRLHARFKDDETGLERFRLEARLASRLQHPHIVTVLEVGTVDALPYFTMRLAEGASLLDWIRDVRPTRRKRIEVLVKIARAIHHAHQRQVVHRDLKPGNVVVSDVGDPVVMDFGIAKIDLEPSDLTRLGSVLGTPRYMAPEQLRGEKDLSTAVDIWGLGVLMHEMLRQTRVDPGSASEERSEGDGRVYLFGARARFVPGERALEQICARCLRPDPTERYTSADAVADDLERWLRREPILARRNHVLTCLRCWFSRHPALALMMVALGLAAASLVYIVLRHQSLVDQLVGDRLASVVLAFDQDDAPRGLSLLGGNPVAAGSPLAPVLASVAAYWESPRLKAWVGPALGHEGSVGISPDFRWIAHIESAGTARLRPAEAEGAVWRIDSSNHVDRLVWVGASTLLLYAPSGVVERWEIGAGRRESRLVWTASLPEVLRLWVASEQRVVAVGREGQVSLLEVGDGRIRPLHSERRADVSACVVSRDGERFAVGDEAGRVTLYALNETTVIRDAQVSSNRITGLLFVPHPTRSVDDLAITSADGALYGWAGLDGERDRDPSWFGSPVSCLAYHPDRKTYALGHDDGSVTVLRSDSWTPLDATPASGHGGPVTDIVFHEKGAALLTGSADGALTLWRPGSRPLRWELTKPGTWIRRLVPQSDGAHVMVETLDGEGALWKLPGPSGQGDVVFQSGSVRGRHLPPVMRVLRDGSVVVGDVAGRLHWQSRAGERRLLYEGSAAVQGVVVSPDQKQLVATFERGPAILVGLTTRTQPLLLGGNDSPVRGAECVSGRESRWVTWHADGRFRLWASGGGYQVAEWRPFDESSGLSPEIQAVAISGDRASLAVLSRSGRIALWRPAADRLGTEVRVSFAGGPVSETLAMDADGQRIVVGSRNGDVACWRTGIETRLLWRATVRGAVTKVQFLPGLPYVAVGTASGGVAVFDEFTGGAMPLLGRLSGRISALGYHAASGVLISGSDRGELKAWSMRTFRSQLLPIRHPAALEAVAMDDSGTWMITSCADGSVRAFRLRWPESFNATAVRFAQVWSEGNNAELVSLGGLLEEMDRLKRSPWSQDQRTAAPGPATIASPQFEP